MSAKAIGWTVRENCSSLFKKTQYKRYCIVWQGVSNLVDCIRCKSPDTMFSISKMLRTAVSYKPIKLGSTYTSVERLKVRVSFSRKTQNLEKILG